MARSKKTAVASSQSPELEAADAPYELPDGWTWGKLGNVVEILDGKRIPINLTEREKRKGKIPYYGATGQVGWIDDYIFNEELVLLGEDGAPFLDPDKHKAYIVRGKSWVNNHAHVLRALGVTLNPYLSHYLNAFDYHDFVNGTTRLKLTQGAMREIPIPLPPLTDQRRIVAQIESLFAESRTARDALERVPALLKRFRQSVLASAFRGDLTERDPNDEPASALLERISAERAGATPVGPAGSSGMRGRPEHGRADVRGAGQPRRAAPTETRKSDLPELPEGWVWVRTEMLAANEPHSFTDGPFGSSLKTADYTSKGVRVIRLQNLGIGEFKNDAKAFVSREKYELLCKHEAKADDVIIAALADPVGRACLVPEGIGTAIVKADCVRLRVDKNLADSKYVMLALNTQEHFKRVEDAAHGVGRLRANFSDIKSLVVPIAPRAEQHRIVAKIESLFAQADAIERAVAIARQRADKIDQAILSRAFRGGLMTED